MVDKIHVWGFPLAEISVKLKPETKTLLFEKSLKYFQNYTNLTSFLSKISVRYRKIVTKKLIHNYYHRAKFTPFWVIYELANFLHINLSIIEKSIVSFISYRGKIIISNPILPVLVTPEFTSILIHAMSDGTVCNGKFFYYQKNRENQQKFYEQIKNVFGNYEVNNKRGHYAPKIVTKVISNFFNI